MKMYIVSEKGSYGYDFYVMSDSKENALNSIRNKLKSGNKYDQETLKDLENYEIYEYKKDEVVFGERN
jgi:hypothetical protein